MLTCGIDLLESPRRFDCGGKERIVGLKAEHSGIGVSENPPPKVEHSHALDVQIPSVVLREAPEHGIQLFNFSIRQGHTCRNSQCTLDLKAALHHLLAKSCLLILNMSESKKGLHHPEDDRDNSNDFPPESQTASSIPCHHITAGHMGQVPDCFFCPLRLEKEGAQQQRIER